MKQQVLLRRLKSSYLALMRAKRTAAEMGVSEVEADPAVVQCRERSHQAWYAAQEHRLDPTSICTRLGRRHHRGQRDR